MNLSHTIARACNDLHGNDSNGFTDFRPEDGEYMYVCVIILQVGLD